MNEDMEHEMRKSDEGPGEVTEVPESEATVRLVKVEECGSSLLALPAEILLEIGGYLSARDLLAMSGSSRRLREVYNDTLLWRPDTQQSNIGNKLTNTDSVLDPSFSEWSRCDSNTLVPLCEERTHFLNQSRLIHNIRKNKHLQYTIPILSTFSTSRFPFQPEEPFSPYEHQITYKNIYLFCPDEYEGVHIAVYNIHSDPHFLTRITLENNYPEYPAYPGYEHTIYFQVVEDKLIVRKSYWIYVYGITLPSLSFPILHSISISELSGSPNVQILEVVLNNIFFVENLNDGVIHAWNVKNGEKLDDISMKIPGINSNLEILGFSKMFLLLRLGFYDMENVCHCLFLYNIEQLEYTSFKAVVSESTTGPLKAGLIDGNHVVLLGSKGRNSCNVSVFDLLTSARVVQKTVKGNNRPIEHSCISHGKLFLPDSGSLEILSITTLEVLWELKGCHVQFLKGVQLFDINQCHLIVVKTKSDESEVWDLTQQRKLFDLPGEFLAFNENFSKLIFRTPNTNDPAVNVLNFW